MIVMNNFAFPGATVEYDLDGQLARFFAQCSAKVPEEATYGKARTISEHLGV